MHLNLHLWEKSQNFEIKIHIKQMVTSCRMGISVGHQEPSQTMVYQNFINIQTTGVPTEAASFNPKGSKLSFL